MSHSATKANPANRYLWGSGNRFGRHDYFSDDHLFSDMQHAEYFSTCLTELQAQDFIYVTDAAHEMHLIRIDEVDKDAKKVFYSIVEAYRYMPIIESGDHGFAVRFRGPRGGHWCILNADGEIVAQGYTNRDRAVRALDIMVKTNSFVAEKGHEPKKKGETKVEDKAA